MISFFCWEMMLTDPSLLLFDSTLWPIDFRSSMMLLSPFCLKRSPEEKYSILNNLGSVYGDKIIPSSIPWPERWFHLPIRTFLFLLSSVYIDKIITSSSVRVERWYITFKYKPLDCSSSVYKEKIKYWSIEISLVERWNLTWLRWIFSYKLL